MALPIYSSREIEIAWGGSDLEGLAPDAAITFSLNSDITDTEVGTDGQLAISQLPDSTGSCTLSFQQNSISNLVLSGVLNFQRANKQLVFANLTMVDPSGGVLAFLRNAHIKTAPEVTLGTTATGSTRDWVFYAEEMLFTSTPDGLLLPDEAARIASAVDTIVTNI